MDIIKKVGTAQVTIASGTTVYTSDAADLSMFGPDVGATFGTLSKTGTMQADVSYDNSTFRALKGSTNEPVTIYAGTGPAAVSVPDLAPWPYVKARHTSTQSVALPVTFVDRG